MKSGIFTRCSVVSIHKSSSTMIILWISQQPILQITIGLYCSFRPDIFYHLGMCWKNFCCFALMAVNLWCHFTVDYAIFLFEWSICDTCSITPQDVGFYVGITLGFNGLMAPLQPPSSGLNMVSSPCNQRNTQIMELVRYFRYLWYSIHYCLSTSDITKFSCMLILKNGITIIPKRLVAIQYSG